jgi:hypothetical protein
MRSTSDSVDASPPSTRGWSVAAICRILAYFTADLASQPIAWTSVMSMRASIRLG